VGVRVPPSAPPKLRPCYVLQTRYEELSIYGRSPCCIQSKSKLQMSARRRLTSAPVDWRSRPFCEVCLRLSDLVLDESDFFVGPLDSSEKRGPGVLYFKLPTFFGETSLIPREQRQRRHLTRNVFVERAICSCSGSKSSPPPIRRHRRSTTSQPLRRREHSRGEYRSEPVPYSGTSENEMIVAT